MFFQYFSSLLRSFFKEIVSLSVYFLPGIKEDQGHVHFISLVLDLSDKVNLVSRRDFSTFSPEI